MSELVSSGFIAVALLAFVFFFFRARQFDLLTVAYIGALFYFSPLFWGRVLQSSPDLDPAVPPEVYLIAGSYVIALVVAGFFTTKAPSLSDRKISLHLSPWYLIITAICLACSVVSSRGEIINADKVKTLAQVGYFYAGFEVAAALACISAVVERRWRILALSAFLLSIDLLIGFRVFVVLAALSVALALLMQEGRIRLFAKAPTYGPAALILVVAMLLVHTARFAIFDQISIVENAPRIVSGREMRGDTLQYEKTLVAPAKASGESNDALIAAWRWIKIPFNLLQVSEPAIIQATLAGIVQKHLSCSQVNIFKSIYLLIPPGFAGLIPNPFPPTFYDEYQPALYPHITYSTGGNIWAEMLCRFGYTGVAIFGVLLILTLIAASRFLVGASTAAAPPIALGGVIIAFYINRNDLHFTLVMLRQVAIVFFIAYCLSGVGTKIRPRPTSKTQPLARTYP